MKDLEIKAAEGSRYATKKVKELSSQKYIQSTEAKKDSPVTLVGGQETLVDALSEIQGFPYIKS